MEVRTDESDIVIEHILDGDGRRLLLVIVEADLVGDDIADLHSAQLAGALVRSRLALVRNLGNGVLHFVQRVLMIVSDLDRSSVAAVDDASGSAVR